MASVHVGKTVFVREQIEHAWVSSPGPSPIRGDDLTIDQDAPEYSSVFLQVHLL